MGLSVTEEILEEHSTVCGLLQQCPGSSVYFCGSHIDLTRLVSQNMPFWAPSSVSRRKVQLKMT